MRYKYMTIFNIIIIHHKNFQFIGQNIIFSNKMNIETSNKMKNAFIDL